MAQQHIAASIFNSSLRARMAALTALAILTALLTTVPAAHAQTFTVLHSFTGGDGANPVAGLTIDAAGNFYGTTEYGGNTSGTCSNRGCGTVFRLKRGESGFTLEELLEFTPEGGGYPLGRVSFGPDGTFTAAR
jgi:hypothetical protein